MAALSTPVFDQAVKCLLPFMLSRQERVGELAPVLSQEPVFNSINWDSAPKPFTVELVKRLSHDQLVVILKRLRLGDEQSIEIEQLCALIETERDSQPLVDNLKTATNGRPATVQENSAALSQTVKRGHSQSSFRCVGVISLLLAVSAFSAIFIFLWLSRHPRPPDLVTHCYTDACRIRGVLTGSDEFLDTQIQHRPTAFRIETQQGMVTRVEAISLGTHRTADHNVPLFFHRENPDQIWSSSRNVCAWVYEYGSDGTVKRELGYDRMDRLMYRLEYRFTDPNRIVADFVDAQGKQQVMSPAGASRVELMLDESGRDLSHRYFDANDEPRPDRDGTYGWKFELNANGQLVKSTRLAKDGQQLAFSDGCVSQEREYNEAGELLTTFWLAEDNKPNSRHEVPGSCFSYHVENDRTLTRVVGHLDANRKPVAAAKGISQTQSRHDLQGKLVRQTFVGTDGKPLRSHPDGYASLEYVYSERGDVRQWRYHGADDSLTETRDGPAVEFFEYDERGLLKAREYRDRTEKSLVEHASLGYAKAVYEYGDAGENHPVDRPWRVSYFNKAGDPLNKGKQPPIKVLTYQNDALVGEAFYQADGKTPWRRNDGISRIQAKWEYGQPPRSACTEYRESGPALLHTQTYFDNGRQVNDGEGVVSRMTVFGPHGSRTREVRAFLRGNREFQNIEYIYDNRDRVMYEFYLDERLAPVELRDGYSSIAYKYDASGRRTLSEYHNLNDDAVVPKQIGYASEHCEYHSNGIVAKHFYCGKSREYVDPPGTFSRMEQQVDKHGRPIKREYWNSHGEECRGPEGCTKLITNYFDDGRVEEEVWYVLDGSAPPTVVRTYDGAPDNTDRKLLGETYRTRDGRDFAIEWGYTAWSVQYDSRQRLSRLQFRSAAPLTNARNASTIFPTEFLQDGGPFVGDARRYVRDVRGHPFTDDLVVRSIPFKDRRLPPWRQSLSLPESVLDEWYTRILLGTASAPENPSRYETRPPAFVTQMAQLWPVMGGGGYTSIRFQYAPGPNGESVSEIVYYDDRGPPQPVACRAGYSALRREHSKDGLLVRDIFLDVMNATGCQRIVREYDKRGYIVGQRYENSPSVLGDARMGYASVVWKYNAPPAEPRFAAMYSDCRGKEVPVRAFVMERVPSVDQGSNAGRLLEAGDLIITYDGTPIGSSADLVCALLRAPLYEASNLGEVSILFGTAPSSQLDVSVRGGPTVTMEVEQGGKKRQVVIPRTLLPIRFEDRAVKN